MDIKTSFLKDSLGAIAQKAAEQLTDVLSEIHTDNKISKLQAVKVRDDNDNWFYLTGEVAENCTQLVATDAGDIKTSYLTITELDAYQIIELLDYLKMAL